MNRSADINIEFISQISNENRYENYTKRTNMGNNQLVSTLGTNYHTMQPQKFQSCSGDEINFKAEVIFFAAIGLNSILEILEKNTGMWTIKTENGLISLP